MLHELLLALVGCTGDVFLDLRERVQSLGLAALKGGKGSGEEADGEDHDDECTFRLAPDISILPLSERDLFNRLLRVGFYYQELDRFTMRCRDLGWIRSPYPNADAGGGIESDVLGRRRAPSVYRRALANGIAEILSVYRSAVLKVEQNLLHDPVPVLAAVTQGVQQFELLFPPLYALVHEVERAELKGGRLLNLLHAKCHSGVPELQACMQRLLWHGHQVMYQQLASWMVYGSLQDQDTEFFITGDKSGKAQAQLSDANPARDQSGILEDDAQSADWNSGFHIRSDMLPDYIQMPVAQSILFVGKAARVLRNPSTSFKVQTATSQRAGSKEQYRPDDALMTLPLPKDSHSPRGSYECPELFPEAEAQKIALMLKGLKESPEFYKTSLEQTIHAIRLIAATNLWQLIVVHADLLGHLKAFKDYFLLAKGDFFQCFLEESRALMSLPPRPSTAVADLKVPFQQAAVKAIGDEKYFSRVSLRMPFIGGAFGTVGNQANARQRPYADTIGTQAHGAFGESSAGPAHDGWDLLELDYAIDWPLHLLFTSEVLAKYCKIFQYLLRLKRIQLELEKSWAEAMHFNRANSRKRQNERGYGAVARNNQQLRMPVWRVRQHMTYLITNLQFYIQVDVIESQWNILQERVEASKDFTELARFHQEYLSALISQSFLDIGSVSRILDSIIKLCLQLCRVVERQDGTASPELKQITEEFNKKSNSLYTILRSSKLAGSHRAPFLRQFLLRLNYNTFFEATARGALNVPQKGTV